MVQQMLEDRAVLYRIYEEARGIVLNMMSTAKPLSQQSMEAQLAQRSLPSPTAC